MCISNDKFEIPCRVPSNMHEDFSLLTNNLLFLSHSIALFVPGFLLKSFTYNINNVGLRIVPSGTPMDKTHDVDEISLHLTICFLLFE